MFWGFQRISNFMQQCFLKNSIRKRLAIVMMCALLLVAVPKPVYAWDAVFGSIAKQAFEILWNTIENLLKGLAKRMAVELAVRQANKLTGNGNKNSPTFITDYKNYLYAAVLDESMTFANTLITQTLGAKYSALVYTVASGNLQSLGRNYMSYLAAEAQMGLVEGSGICKYTLDQYSTDPIMDLQKGNWRVFNAMVANPCNNPSGYVDQTRRLFAADLQRRQELAKTKALAGQGFIGAEKNGIITAPGSIIREITAKAQTQGFELITAANGWGEILSAAGGAFMNQLMTNLIQNGFESVSKKVNRELGKVDKKVLEARRDIEQSLGPGGNYLRNTVQQTGNAATKGFNNQINDARGRINFNSAPNCTVDQGC